MCVHLKENHFDSSRLMVVSHEAKKKQQVCALQDYAATTVSNLHACQLKFLNAVVKAP